MKSKKILAAIAALLILFLNACSANEVTTKYNLIDSQEIHIGLAYPAEKISENVHLIEGVNLAVKSVNDSGGVLGKKLNVLIRDDNGDTNLAMQMAQTFYEQGIHSVIGHWSTNVSYFVEDIYENNKVIMMTPRSSGLSLLKDNSFDYVYRMSANNSVYADAIADYLYDNGYKRPVIYYTDDEYGNDFAQIVESSLFQRGLRVVDRVNHITDYGIQKIFRRWRALGCDSVVFATTFPDYLEPLKVIHDNSSYPIFGADNFDYRSVTESTTLDLSRIYKAAISANTLDSDFLELFSAEYGFLPDLAAIYGYQSVKLLADAMNNVQDIQGPSIAGYLSSLKDYNTVFGPISYNSASGEFEDFGVSVNCLLQGE